MDSNFYLEISPRGSGKTWRIVRDIASNIFSNEDFRAAVFTRTQRAFECIKTEVERLTINNTDKVFRFTSISDVKPIKGLRYYFDEFEWLPFLKAKDLQEIVKADVYFSSSVSKIRVIEDLDTKKDVLAKLLELNDGYYVSRVPLLGDIYNRELFANARESMSSEIFESEFLNRFLK